MLTPGAKIFVRFALWLSVSEIQGRQKLEMHRMTPNWTWTLNSQNYPIYTVNIPPEGHILVRFALRPVVFKIQGRQKWEIHRMTPNWTGTHNSQKYPVYTKYLPCGPYFAPFSYVTSHFRGLTMSFKSRKCTECPQTQVEHLTVKSTLYTSNTYPWGPNLVRFALWPAVSKILYFL